MILCQRRYATLPPVQQWTTPPATLLEPRLLLLLLLLQTEAARACCCRLLGCAIAWHWRRTTKHAGRLYTFWCWAEVIVNVIIVRRLHFSINNQFLRKIIIIVIINTNLNPKRQTSKCAGKCNSLHSSDLLISTSVSLASVKLCVHSHFLLMFTNYHKKNTNIKVVNSLCEIFHLIFV